MSEKKKNEVNLDSTVELSDDDLDQVAGGKGMRNVKFTETVDISEDTLNKLKNN